MNKKRYCIDCGHPNTIIAKFCENCGLHFASGKKLEEAASTAPQKEETVVELPKLKPSDFIIEGTVKPLTMNDLIWSPKMGIKREEGSDKSGKELLQEIRDECKPSQAPTII